MDAGFTVAAANAVFAIAKFAAITGASMAASKLLRPKPPSLGDTIGDRSQMIRSPIAARQIVYGRARVSGVLVYISTTGTKNEYLHMVIALAGHEVEEIGDVYFNDELALTGPGSACSGRFTGFGEVYKKLGGDSQTVETNLEAATAGLTDGKWTSNHRLRGIAYIYVRLVWDAKVFVGGIPNVSAIVKGKKVYDPRSGLTAYSANAALCLRDYLTSPLGLAMDSSEIDDNAVEEAANICDEFVQTLPLFPPAYERRYEANGVVSTSDTPDDNIGRLLSAMGGLIAYSGGQVVMYAGAYRVPTVTLTEKHFVGALSVQTRTSARDRVNGVKGLYISEENQWQASDFPARTSTTYVSEDNGIRYWRDVSLPMTTSNTAAQRLAVIELRRAREEITMTARFRLEAMQVRAGDTVMITNAKLGWTDKVFEVMDWHFVSEGNPPQLAVEMTLRETASTCYSWDITQEVFVDDAPNTTLPDPFTLGAPTNLTLTADGTTQLVQADGTAMPRIKVAWSAPSEQFIQSGGSVAVEYKQGTSTTYLTWSTVPGDTVEDYISSDVKIGLTYDVRIFGKSYFGVSTSYLSASVTVQKDTIAPTAPSGLVATVGTGKVVGLDWNDNTEPDLSEYGIWRSTDAVNYTQIAEARASAFVDVSVALGTTYYYKVNAYDFLENVSGFSNVVTAVPTFIPSGSVDPNAPADPSAPTLNTSGSYSAGDGTVFSRLVINVPAMPSGAVILNVLYRRNGTTGWIVADQRSTGGGTSSIDDLSPGVSYEVAAQAFSTFGVGSSIVTATGSPFTAPNSTDAPAAPAWGELSASAPAKRNNAGTGFQYGARATWAAVNDSAVIYYEIKSTLTDSDAATDYNWGSTVGTFPNTPQTAKLEGTRFDLYSESPAPNGYVRVRAVNRSMVASSWLRIGDASSVGVIGAGNSGVRDVGTSSGTVAAGDDTRITGAAQKSSNLSDLTNVGTARTNLGLGSMATQNSNAVSISGGDVDGVESTGIKFDGGNSMKLLWDSPNVKAYVDGSLQGIIPNDVRVMWDAGSSEIRFYNNAGTLLRKLGADT